MISLLIGLLHEPDEEVLDHLPDLHEGVRRHAISQRGEHTAFQLAGPSLQEACCTQPLPALHFRPERSQGGAALHQAWQMLGSVPRHGLALDNLDRFGNGLQLLRSERLAALVVLSLLIVRRGEVAEVLLVGILGHRRLFEVPLGGRPRLQLLRLDLGLEGTVLLRLLDLGLEVLAEHLICLPFARLLLLELRPLSKELLEQLRQHVDDTLRLELVTVRFWRARGNSSGRVLLEEGVDGFSGLVRQEAQVLERGKLQERVGLGTVMRLLLQHSDRALEGINGLRVVLVCRLVVYLLDLSHLRHFLDVAGPTRHVLIVRCDLCGQALGIRRALLDLCLQRDNALLGLLDGTPLLRGEVSAELPVGSVLDLLLVLLGLALYQHALHQLNNLLHGRHPSGLR
mmetsp:Transcript_26118/g.82891  ORF Transcript_26118/g.82891 Transcript_26118/m.82891 type:complete len:399 (-) Transcript_26118:136-1332(-)